MTIAWSQVEAKPEFQSLSPKEKAEAQEQYFNEVVAPKAGDDAEDAKKQFFTQYNYSEQENNDELPKDLIRPDGTRKGTGFLGVLKNKNGQIVTEYSVGVNIGGKEIDIPTLVPGLTPDEIKSVLSASAGEGDIPRSVIDKAVKNARSRIASGQSPFVNDGGLSHLVVGGGSQPEVGQEQEPTMLESAKDLFTGKSKMTPEIEGMSEIGNAPELNELSLSAIKTSFGLLVTGDPDKAMSMIKSQIPSAEFRKDSKGNDIITLPSGEYLLNSPGWSAQDTARGLFNLAMFTPASIAIEAPALLAKNAAVKILTEGASVAAKSGATELALQSATKSLGGGDIDYKDVALSAVTGAAGNVAGDVAGAVSKIAKGAPTGKIKAIEEFAKAHDLPLMTTDVVQPKTFIGKSAQAAAEKIPLAGTGGSRRAQQEARTELVEDYAKSFGEYHPEDVVSSLKRQTSKIKRAAGNSRQVIMDQLDKSKVTSTNAIDAIDAEIERLGKSPSGATRTTADTATIDKLKAYKNDLMSDSSFANIVDLRTQFRTHVKGERMVMPSQSNAAVNRIYSAMSKDMEDTVQSNLGGQALGKWKKSNAVYANEANKIKNTRLKSALQKGDLTPEVINNMLYSNKPSEVKTLFKSLDTKGKASARAGIMAKAIDKSKGSPDSFLNELNKMSAQTGIAFKGNDREYLKGLKSYLDATRRAGKAGVLTPTGQELFQIAAPAAVAADLLGSGGVGIASAASYGLLAKAYESKPIRVAMLRLKGMPKGSTKFEDQLRKISQMLSTTAQAIRSQDK